MRLLTVIAGSIFCCQSLWAQASPPAQLTGVEAGQGRSPAIEQQIERIRIESDGSTLEELRYGGQAQQLSVTPKGGLPGYQIVPGRNGTSGTDRTDNNLGTAGQPAWNLLRF